MQNYHPSRVLTLVYQPFALGALAILAYNEAKINTRRRNLFGYILFFLSSLAVLVVSSLAIFLVHDRFTLRMATEAYSHPQKLPYVFVSLT